MLILMLIFTFIILCVYNHNQLNCYLFICYIYGIYLGQLDNLYNKYQLKKKV